MKFLDSGLLSWARETLKVLLESGQATFVGSLFHPMPATQSSKRRQTVVVGNDDELVTIAHTNGTKGAITVTSYRRVEELGPLGSAVKDQLTDTAIIAISKEDHDTGAP